MLKVSIIIGALALIYVQAKQGFTKVPLTCQFEKDSLGGDVNQGKVNILCTDLTQDDFENFAGQLSGKSFEIVSFINCNFNKLKNFVFPDVSIEQLNIEDTPIETIENDAFTKVRNLKSLRIEKTKVKTIPSLKQVASELSFLQLRYNQIEKLLREEFSADLVNVEEIILDYNAIQSIEDGAFQDLINLRTVHLKGNKITKIGNWFADANNITDLDFSNNKIEAIPENFFTSLKLLADINLEFNEIKTVTKSTFEPLIRQTQALAFIHDNALVCDKRLCWLYEYSRTPVFIQIDGDCKEPDNLKGIPFSAVGIREPHIDVNCTSS